MEGLDGTSAVVTGGGRGIGEAIGRRLAAAGARVVVADIDTAAAEAVAAAIGGVAVTADVTVTDDVDAMVRTCTEHFGGLDIAVNNAGIGGAMAPLADYPPDVWDRVIAVNLTSVFHCMRAEIAVMREAGRGSIVNMTSMLGQVAFPAVSAYVAAKHGVVGLTKAAALDHGADGIRVNAVGPTFITTELVTSTIDQEGLDAIAAGHPGGRLGTPEEVAELVAWLASDAASLAQGGFYPADGGWLAR
jgi:NAD(P)-dependent dehydrogenase (short-subunit alcohol dehydrogenase family)